MAGIDYKSIIDNSPIGYGYHRIICDKEGIPCDYEFIEVNAAFEDYTGLKASDIVGKTVNQVLPGLNQSEVDWIGVYGGIALGGGVHEFDGFSEQLSKHYHVKVFSPEKNYFVTLFSDISQELILKENSKKKETDFRSIFKNMSSGAAIYSVINDGARAKDYIIKDINKEGLKIEGKKKKQVIGLSVGQLRPRVEEFGLIKEFKKVFETGKPKKYPPKRYTGENRYFEYSIFKLTSDEIIATYNDVTDLMQTQKELKTSRNRFRQYIEKAPYGVFVTDSSGNCIEVNAAACRMTGYSKNELVGQNAIMLVPKEDQDNVRPVFDTITKENYLDMDVRVVTKKAEIRDWNVRAIRISENSFLGFTVDVTEKKKVEKKLADSEQEFRALFDHAGLAIGYYRPDGTVIWYNKAAAENMGGKPNDFKGKTVYDLFCEQDAEKFMRRISKIVKKKKALEYEDNLKIPAGQVWCKSTFNSIYKDNGDLLGIQVISQDITELKQTQQSLAQNEKRFRVLFEDAPMGYQSLNQDGRFIDVNNAWLELFGYKKDEVIGKWFGDFLAPENVMAFKTNFPKFIKRGKTVVTFEMMTKNKERLIVKFDGRIAFDEAGNFKQTHCLLQNITEQTKAENELIESEQKYRAMFDQATAGICSYTMDGKYIDANKKYCDIVGYSLRELKKRTYLDITHRDDIKLSKDLFSRMLKGENNIYREKRYIRKDGNIAHVIVSGSMIYDMEGKPLYSVATIQDITERKVLESSNEIMESHLRNQQKLESIGVLAGGVAHEINNPINGIMNYSQLIMDCEPGDEVVEYANEILHESNRISTIVKNLLQFSRHEKQSYSKAKIEDIVFQTLSLIRTIIKNDQIDFVVNVPKNMPMIKCRSQQIQQVLMNLLTNGRDALNQKYKGYDDNKKLILTCRRITRDKSKWIRITVEDHGKGIKKEIADNIFDPFFTTKSKDEGTGLGLAISYGIVKEHHGMLTFDTKEGSHTRFYLDLPVDNGWELEDNEGES